MHEESKLAQKAALVAALSAAILAVIKLSLFLATGSLVIALSAWDSSMDVIVSLINRKIVKFSRQDADSNHPYGHGKAESIAALGQGCLILGGGVVIIFSGIKQMFFYYKNTNNSHFIQNNVDHWGYVVFFIFATVVSYFVSRWLNFNGKKLNSPALLADSEHYHVDLITNLASALALTAVIIFKKPILDSMIASIFSIYIIYGATKLIRTSIRELMDHDIPEEIKTKVIKLIHSTNPNVIDVHKLRGRRTGHCYYFDCHVTLTRTLSFIEVHEIVEKIEVVLENSYGGDMVIHADPSPE